MKQTFFTTNFILYVKNNSSNSEINERTDKPFQQPRWCQFEMLKLILRSHWPIPGCSS